MTVFIDNDIDIGFDATGEFPGVLCIDWQDMMPFSVEGWVAYDFYASFGVGKDEVSKQPLVVEDLASGRVTYDGTVAGEDEATIGDDGLVTYGGYSNLIKYSEDFANSLWISQGDSIITPNQAIAPDGTLTAALYHGVLSNHALRQDVSGSYNQKYTFSLWVKSAGLGNDTFRLYGNRNTGSTDFVATDTWKLFSFSLLYILSGNEWGVTRDILNNPTDVYIWHPSITQSPYQLPYIKTEATAVAVAENYSTTDQGYYYPVVSAWDGTGSETAWDDCKENLVDALDGEVDGVELVTNGDFSDGINSWINREVYSYDTFEYTDGLHIVLYNDAQSFCGTTDTISVVAGERYKVVIKYVINSGELYGFYIRQDLGVGSIYTNSLNKINTSGTEVLYFISPITQNVTIHTYSLKAVDMVIKNASVQKVQPATGQINIKWQPRFNAGDIGASQNILTTNNSIESLCWYDDVNGKLKTTDGTNTSEVDCTPVSGTTYNTKINYDESTGLCIALDDVEGTGVDFAGRFPTDNDLTISWEAEAPQYVKVLSVGKESSLITPCGSSILTLGGEEITSGGESITSGGEIVWASDI